MRLPVIVAACLVSMASQFTTAQEPKPKPKADAELILGTWKAESEDDGSGRVISFKDLKLDMRYTFKEKGVISNNGDDPKTRDGTYTIDLSANPKRITANVGGAKFTAIYKLEGDKLTVCYSMKENQPCPTKFKADAASGTSVMIFQRVKEKK